MCRYVLVHARAGTGVGVYGQRNGDDAGVPDERLQRRCEGSQWQGRREQGIRVIVGGRGGLVSPFIALFFQRTRLREILGDIMNKIKTNAAAAAGSGALPPPKLNLYALSVCARVPFRMGAAAARVVRRCFQRGGR